jgi:hypothetical protein
LKYFDTKGSEYKLILINNYFIMNKYELVVLVDSRLPEEEIGSNIKTIDEIL